MTIKTTWLNRFAWLTALATLGLIGMGGLVTSKGVGMAVPDWPTTYGYNMFLFPVSQWVGGIFYEHTHRLWASGVGLLTTILAVWMWMHKPATHGASHASSPRPYPPVGERKADDGAGLSRATLRWLGVLAFVLVSVQGVLGGLRVTLYKDGIGIFHGVLAQLFLVLVFGIALYTSPWWQRISALTDRAAWAANRQWLLGVTLLILVQLTLGAAMRHQHAGLAVPDFPLAYGKLWPPTDPAFLETVNQARVDARDFKPIQASHIHLHMAHRVGALAILGAVIILAWRVRRQAGARAWLSRLTLAWCALILLQAALGAMTVWSNKAADVATLHVVLGAISLVYGSLLALVAQRVSHRQAATVNGVVAGRLATA